MTEMQRWREQRKRRHAAYYVSVLRYGVACLRDGTIPPPELLWWPTGVPIGRN